MLEKYTIKIMELEKIIEKCEKYCYCNNVIGAKMIKYETKNFLKI